MLDAFESAGVMDPAWRESGKPIPWEVHAIQVERAKTDPDAAFYIQFLTWSRGCAPTVYGRLEKGE